jgi:ABC-type nickel/cobalt efflux system permease component RcnA
MENSSIFWNKIADWLTSLGITYISPTAAVLILAAAFLVLLFFLWLIFRKLRLWYWKTNIQIDTLKSIDVRLHNVEEKLTTSPVMIVGKGEDNTPEQLLG